MLQSSPEPAGKAPFWPKVSCHIITLEPTAETGKCGTLSQLSYHFPGFAGGPAWALAIWPTSPLLQ